MRKSFHRVLTMALALMLLLSQAALAVDTDAIFKTMPTSDDLSKAFNGRMPEWVHFPYDIDGEATLWTTDTEDTWGLVYLDTYKLDAETGEYLPFNVGRYPGHMTSDDFLNYGPPYGEHYYPKDVCMPGQYRSTWRVPIFGTNTEDANVYEYAAYTVDFDITLPGIFTSISNLNREADGTPAEVPDITFEYAVPDLEGQDVTATAAHAWFAYDAEAEDMLGEELDAAPADQGAYVYRCTVADGTGAVIDTLTVYFELAAPKLFYRLAGADSAVFTSVPPVQVSKTFDGTPVTLEDFGITYDMSIVDKADEAFEASCFWWRPDENGSYNQSIAELEGGDIGPSEPGSYNLQFCLNGDNVEAYIYAIFTITEPEAEPGDVADATVSFFDVTEDDWFYDAVMFVANEAHLFQGVGGGNFAPEAGMSSAMLATVLHRMMDQPNATETPDSWYADGLAWAIEAGMLPDFNDADTLATRQEVVFALYACAHEGALADDYGAAMDWAVEAGLVVGDDAGDLAPEAAVTRAQVAQILMGYLAD